MIVEDNDRIRQLMALRLEQEGHACLQAADGVAALACLDTHAVDLLICDLMMPNLDGFGLLAQVRALDKALPVLIVTARDEFDHKKRGFQLGSDDYMVKPVDLNELCLRVAALLRRARINAEHRITLGNLTLDQENLTLTTGAGGQELTKKEFQLLFKLVSYPGRIFTRQQLLDDLWGPEAESEERTVDAHIKKLRKHLEGTTNVEIVTIRGLGYKAERRS